MNVVDFLLKQVSALPKKEKQEFAQGFEQSRKELVRKKKRTKKTPLATEEEIINCLRKRGIWKDQKYWEDKKEAKIKFEKS